MVKAASEFKGSLHGASWFGDERKQLLRKELEDQLIAELPKHIAKPKLKQQSGVRGFFGSDVVGKLKTTKGESVLDLSGHGHAGVGASLRKTPFLKKWVLEADALYLKPEHQKKGIGSAGIKALTTAARNLGADAVTLQADNEGKVVWSRTPGVTFQNDSRAEVHGQYKKWRKKHGGPDLSSKAEPREYPKEFLREAGSEMTGFIGYKIPVNEGQSHAIDPVPLGIATGVLALGAGAVAARKFLKLGAADPLYKLSSTSSQFAAETYESGTHTPTKHVRARGQLVDGQGRAIVTKLEPEPEESTDILIGRTDQQLHPQSISDGVLHTNMNEDDDHDPEKEAAAWKIGPPPMPNREQYPFVGTINFRGLKIGIENAPGTWRTGKGWKTLMKNPYGEFLHGKAGGTDGDKLDVFVGPSRNCENVYIIHQNFVRGPEKGKYDEDKVMLGFDTPAQAKKAYLAHYDSDKYFRSMTTMAFPLFKRALVGGEVDGEKVASVREAMANYHADMRLEDLFSTKSASTRERTWRDKVTGGEATVRGSGVGQGLTKTASLHEVSPAVLKIAAVLRNGWSASDLLKVSNETKAASHLKWAEIVKRIGPSKAVGRVTPLLSQTEESLPKEILDEMGQRPDLEKSLATPSLMGMVLKPEEFQRIMLTHLGKGPLADKMDAAGAVFKPSDEEACPCSELGPEHMDPEIMKALLPSLEGKSYVGPIVRRRITRIVITKPKPEEPSTEVESPLLSKVASAYTWYRREQMKLASALPTTITAHPELHAGVYGLGLEDAFSKTAELKTKPLKLDNKSLAVVLGSVPLALMYSAHKRGERASGKELGAIGDLIADHPWLTAMGTVTGMGALLRNPHAQQAVDEVFAAGKRVWEGKGDKGSKVIRSLIKDTGPAI
jgi:GNAT superfamily N-acetyltransferase